MGRGTDLAAFRSGRLAAAVNAVRACVRHVAPVRHVSIARARLLAERISQLAESAGATPHAPCADCWLCIAWLGGCRALVVEVRICRREDRFSTSCRPIVALWGKNRRKYGARRWISQAGRATPDRLPGSGGRKALPLAVAAAASSGPDAAGLSDRSGHVGIDLVAVDTAPGQYLPGSTGRRQTGLTRP